MRRIYSVMTNSARGTSKTADERHRGPERHPHPYALFPDLRRQPAPHGRAADPELVHKSAAVAAAYRSVTDATGTRTVPVQQHVAAVELVAGVVHDPLFGSLVMPGLGGVNTDLFAYRVLRLLPVNTDAAAMWRSLRTAPLLTEYRGGPAVDTQAVEELLLRLGRLAETLPEVAELDLNPFLAGSDGVVAVDVKLRLAPVTAEPDPARRYGNCANPDEPARRHGEASGGAARRSDRPPGRGGGPRCRRSPRVGGSSGRPWRVIVRTAARTGRAAASGWTGADRRRPR
jgi:hypothetical protein